MRRGGLILCVVALICAAFLIISPVFAIGAELESGRPPAIGLFVAIFAGIIIGAAALRILLKYRN